MVRWEQRFSRTKSTDCLTQAAQTKTTHRQASATQAKPPETLPSQTITLKGSTSTWWFSVTVWLHWIETLVVPGATASRHRRQRDPSPACPSTSTSWARTTCSSEAFPPRSPVVTCGALAACVP